MGSIIARNSNSCADQATNVIEGITYFLGNIKGRMVKGHWNLDSSLHERQKEKEYLKTERSPGMGFGDFGGQTNCVADSQ